MLIIMTQHRNNKILIHKVDRDTDHDDDDDDDDDDDNNNFKASGRSLVHATACTRLRRSYLSKCPSKDPHVSVLRPICHYSESSHTTCLFNNNAPEDFLSVIETQSNCH